MLIIGEAWGESEEMTRQPFVGASGQELWRMLGEASAGGSAADLHTEAARGFKYGPAWIKHREPWLAANGIAFTNVFNLRPLANKIESLCGAKADVGAGYSLPPFSMGKYFRPEYLSELTRLQSELEFSSPNLILCCGNSACWAVLQSTNIGSIRGAIASARAILPGTKVLPTYHPAGVLRQWSWRTIVLADLIKAFREAEFPEIIRPERRVLINPSLSDINSWLTALTRQPPEFLSVDIETGQGMITCIGFGAARDNALVIPFVDLSHPSGSYWSSLSDELKAWAAVRWLLESSWPKLFQNGVYDLQYILRMGFQPANVAEDSMLLHHSLFPELQKGLGFLGSVYTNEASWKLMRKHKADTEKRDE